MDLQLKEQFSFSYSSKFANNKEQLDYLATLYSSLIMSSIKWCLTHHYSDIKEISSTFAKQIYLALENF